MTTVDTPTVLPDRCEIRRVLLWRLAANGGDWAALAAEIGRTVKIDGIADKARRVVFGIGVTAASLTALAEWAYRAGAVVPAGDPPEPQDDGDVELRERMRDVYRRGVASGRWRDYREFGRALYDVTRGLTVPADRDFRSQDKAADNVENFVSGVTSRTHLAEIMSAGIELLAAPQLALSEPPPAARTAPAAVPQDVVSALAQIAGRIDELARELREQRAAISDIARAVCCDVSTDKEGTDAA